MLYFTLFIFVDIKNIYRIINFDTFELSSKKSIKIDVKKFSMKVL